MKENEIQKAHGLYLCGMSLSQVAVRFKVKRQSLHYYFQVRGLKTRPLVRTKQIMYNGEPYTKSKNSRRYWRKTIGDRETLHRQVWKDHNGHIPPGMDVHHLDGDRDNNDIGNLEMLTKSDHTKEHGFKNNQFTKKNPQKYDYDAIECNHCGKIWTKKDSAHFRQRKFCGRKCHYAYAKGKRNGVKKIEVKKLILKGIK